MNFINYLVNIYKLNSFSRNINFLKSIKIYIEWRKQFGKEPIDLSLPWITIDAKNYIVNWSKGKRKIVFEYGMGGSSLFFLSFCDKLFSVDHDSTWFHKTNDLIKIKGFTNWDGYLKEPTFNSQVIYGNCSNPDLYESDDDMYNNMNFKDYVTIIDQFPDNYFDLILIDGRSRPSCIKHSISKVSNGGLIVIDNSERNYYFENTMHFLTNFELVLDSYDALICSPTFTKTKIFYKK
jgi:hypothetical protein